ncbi:enoyl-CoA hydratase/isomerase family protein [Amycolatopsis jejuensis]|uniref:enoyl-CoA hydratase/isomerase family protein n=1 Tax=Amycolatopsis jejuensis TaxID=330084 RepID=UPI000524D949|nr:enoyl-CoA hydratase-related protein [Amycolatopsis jejuensis]
MIPSAHRDSGLGYRKVDGIAWLTLDRPDRGNALSPALRHALTWAWDDVRDDPAVRVAVVTGAGDKHFCTGADLSHRVAQDRRGEPVSPDDRPFEEVNSFTARHRGVWKPVICAVNGLAASAGLHFVVDADLVIAAETAAFCDTHVDVGQVGAIENIGLAKRLPLGTALRMTLMGRAYRLSAERAYQLGLVDELTTPGALLATAEEMARQLMAVSPRAQSLSQQAIWRSLDMGYAQATELGWAYVRMQWAHPDATEGPRAFAERRPPRWYDGGQP